MVQSSLCQNKLEGTKFFFQYFLFDKSIIPLCVGGMMEMTVFCPFWNGFLIKLVNGDKGFLNNVIGDEFDEFKFAESGEMIWEWDRLMLFCGLIRIKFELLRLLGLCKTESPLRIGLCLIGLWRIGLCLIGLCLWIGLCKTEFGWIWGPVRRILALSASQALLRSSNDVGAGLFSVKLPWFDEISPKLNPGKNRFFNGFTKSAELNLW